MKIIIRLGRKKNETKYFNYIRLKVNLVVFLTVFLMNVLCFVMKLNYLMANLNYKKGLALEIEKDKVVEIGCSDVVMKPINNGFF